jgi:P-type E1-E2 ATPase
MGGSNIICLDKTGTLTKNNLKVTHAYLQEKIMSEAAENQDKKIGNWNLKMHWNYIS